jgi:hypothetical protein
MRGVLRESATVSARLRVFSFASILFALTPRTGIAEGPETSTEQARVAFERAVKFSEKAQWEDAERAFAESATLAPTANALLNLAVARFQLKRPLEGLEALDELERHPTDVSPEQAARARAIRERLNAQVAALSLRVVPASAEVRIDGRRIDGPSPVRLRLDPGNHELAVAAAGYLSTSRQIATAPGSTLDLEVTLVPAAAANLSSPSSPVDGAAKGSSFWKSPWLWLGVGLATAAATTAIVVSSRTENGPIGGSEGLIVSPK